MSDYGLSRKQLRRLRHNSISQAQQIYHGVQGEPGYPLRTAPPNPDAEPARVTHERRMERVREAHPDFPVRSEYAPEDRGVGGYLSDVRRFWDEHDDDCDCRKEAG